MVPALVDAAAVGFAPSLSGAMFNKLKPGPGHDAAEVANHQRARIDRAMIALSAERGYRAVTVRELSRLAGVSSRAFYEQYDGKEACMLHCHLVLVRRLLRELATVDAAVDHPGNPGKLVRVSMRALGRDPQVARLLLIGPQCEGEAALEQERCANQLIAAQLGDSFQRCTGVAELPRPSVDGIVAGLIGVAIRRALAGRTDELLSVELGDRLSEWVRSVASGQSFLSQGSSSKAEGEMEERAPSGDLALLLSATAKLAVKHGYSGLSVRRILSAAGLPRRRFSAHFTDVDDCFATAVEGRMKEALERSRRLGETASSPRWGVRRFVAALSLEIHRDPVLTGFCSDGMGAPRAVALRVAKRLTDRMGDLLRDLSSIQVDPRNEVAIEAAAWGTWDALGRELRGTQPTDLAPLVSCQLLLARSGQIEEPTLSLADGTASERAI
jgi:AcrR family transcriptional regulator